VVSTFASAAKTLIHQRSFLITASVTLAIGIGAATALFSTVDAVVLKPLPYPRAQDIYTVRTYYPNGRFTSGLVGVEELDGLKAYSDAVIRTAATLRSDVGLTVDDVTRQAVAFSVSEGFFEVFALPYSIGQGFTAGDHVLLAPRTVVISHRLWQSAFGGRSDVVGRTVSLSGHPGRVVAVAAPDFDVPAGTDLWLNMPLPPSGVGHVYEAYIRVKPGVTVESLRPRMAATMEALGRKYPDQEKDRAYRLVSLQDDLVGDLRAVLLIVFAATGLLLALAIANVTNLTLARGTGRTREIAIRAALGASRRRLVTLLVAESVLTAICGGVMGVTAAFVGTTLLLRAGAAHLPRLAEVSFDLRVLGFALIATTLTGVLVGIAPAVRMADTDIAALLNESGRSVRGSRKTRRLLGAFVIAEVAIAVALVAGAGRLIRSFDNLQRTDPGFDPRGVLAIDVLLPYSYNSIQRVDGWWREVERQLRASGATQVAAASALPLQHEWDTSTFVDIASQPGALPEKRPNGRLRRITPGFFSALGIRLHAGRAFSDTDNAAAPAVVIVNQAFVRRFLGSADPLGERFTGFGFVMIDGKPQRRDAAVVGVVNDVQYAGLGLAPEPTVYVPISQVPANRQTIVLTTPDGKPDRLIPQLRRALRNVDPAVPADLHPASALVSAALERQRVGMLLMTLFGIAALALSLVGVFGVISYVVAQRAGEMAVRQALGASRSHIFWLIGGHGGRLALSGAVIGLALAWWMGRLVSAYVFHVKPADPLILVTSAGLVSVAAACATLRPAWLAATRDARMGLRDS